VASGRVILECMMRPGRRQLVEVACVAFERAPNRRAGIRRQPGLTHHGRPLAVGELIGQPCLADPQLDIDVGGRRELVGQACEGNLRYALEGRGEQCLLGRSVAVEETDADPGAVGDGLHRGALVPVVREGRSCRLPDARIALGGTLGPDRKHWFRAKFGGGRFRLFFRYSTSAKIIIFAWVNDRDTLRTYGAKSDAYAVFAKMLDSGNPPEDWNALISASADLKPD